MSANGVVLDYSQMTIEHLAPQSSALPSSLSESDVASIGNLLMVEKNFNGVTLANKSFGAKKQALQASKVFLDPVIKGAADWTKAEITTRAKWLATNAFQKVWKI